MQNNTRRKFLRKLGLTVGALAVGTEMMYGFPPFQKQVKPFTRTRPEPPPPPVDHRYAPAEWQSAVGLPNDPFKSLVSKHGALLYGHPGPGVEHGDFAQIVSWGFRDKDAGTFRSQTMESAAVPIVTTTLDWTDLSVVLTAFATTAPAEGRVDTLLVSVTSKAAKAMSVTPELRIASKIGFSTDSKDDARVVRKEIGVVTLESRPERLFFVVDSPVDHSEEKGVHHFRMKKLDLAPGASATYVVRFPQEAQSWDLIAGGLARGEDLRASARSAWQAWAPYAEKSSWKLTGSLGDALIASSRTMDQCRLSKDGKGSYLSGPSVSRHVPVSEGVFMAEAAMYLGKEAEARETIVAIWDRQDEQGAILSPTGETRSRDTALAILALFRHAELTQDWTYFNEIYPDAYKGAVYLRDLRNAAANDGTANGTYGLIQKGPGDNGLSGVRAEFSDTLLVLAALKLMLETGDRFILEKRSEIREFYGQLRAAFIAAARKEMKQHPGGFKYLPMLMAGDDLWNSKDQAVLPRPQTAQIALSQAIYPGLILSKDDAIVTGHMALMNASLREEVPAETGWLSHDGVWNAHAAVAAQVLLWAGNTAAAHAMFVGFLNHSSPMWAWRQEQSLLASATPRALGDMPQSWAAAECVRFLRHMLVLEDDKTLRLFNGLSEADIAAGKPFALGSTPTRWGRVSVSLEPVDAKTWTMKFHRDPIDEPFAPALTYVTLPLRLPGNLQIDKFSGPKLIKNSPVAMIDPTLLSWEMTWKNFRRS